MTEFAIDLQKTIRSCTSLTEKEKNDLCLLVRKDDAMKPERYWSKECGEERRCFKCASCGRYLRMRSGKDEPEKNRFCPECGQRVDWWKVFREREASDAKA